MSAVSDLSLVLQKQVGAGPDLAAKGAWVAETAYAVNDSVTRSGKTYVATATTTGDDPATDGAAHWSVIGTGSTGAAMVNLSNAIISSFKDMVTSRKSRRVGLLGSLVTVSRANDSVEKQASCWNEIVEAEGYLNAAIANDQNLGAFRVVDQTVMTALTAGLSQATLNTMAGLFVDSASDFAALTAQELPA